MMLTNADRLLFLLETTDLSLHEIEDKLNISRKHALIIAKFLEYEGAVEIDRELFRMRKNKCIPVEGKMDKQLYKNILDKEKNLLTTPELPAPPVIHEVKKPSFFSRFFRKKRDIHEESLKELLDEFGIEDEEFERPPHPMEFAVDLPKPDVAEPKKVKPRKAVKKAKKKKVAKKKAKKAVKRKVKRTRKHSLDEMLTRSRKRKK